MSVVRIPPPEASLTVESPQTLVAETTTLTPGNTADLDSTPIPANTTGYLAGLYVSGSAPWSFDLYTVSNDTESVKRLRGHGFGAVYFPMPHKTFITVAHDAGAGFDGFRARLKNEDTGSQAGDFAVSFFWDQEA